MQPALSCPQRDDYKRLIHGELPPSDVQRLSQHLAGCSSCAAAVQTLLSEDTLLSALRGTTVDAPPLHEEVPAHLTRRLLALPAQSPSQWGCIGTPSQTSILDPAQAPDEIGRLGSYRVLKVLGSGGMGIVFQAQDVHLKRVVALKVMKPEAASKPGAKERSLREAQLAAALEHEHIVRIYQVGEERGVPYLAMQWLRGMSLEERLKRSGPPSIPEVLRLGRQIARGLAAAHARGLIHRDIKPSNLWLEELEGEPGTSAPRDHVKILDFGLARAVEDAAHLTQSGVIVGTPAYMAPEQARGEKVDYRCDLFSLGVVLYQLCTRRLPFRSGSTMAVLSALAMDTPKPVGDLNPAVPPDLAALVMQLLTKDPTRRLDPAADVARRLADIEAGCTVSPSPVQPVEPPNPWADIHLAESGSPLAIARGSPPARRFLVAAAVLFVLFGGLLLGGQIIIKIYDDKGRKAVELTVPEGGKAVVEKDGKPIATLPGATESPEKRKDDKPQDKKVPVTDPDRRAAEWVLSVGGTVRIRQGEQERNIQAAKDLPTAPCQVVLARLNHVRKVDDAGLAHLKGLTNLVELYAYGTGVRDAGLAHLEGLTSLTRLNLGGTQVGDAGLAHLKGLTNLTELALDDTGVRDAGLAHLEGLTSLTRLQLGGTQVSGAGLVHLKGLTSLTVLQLSGTQVRDAGLVHLKGLTELTELWLTGTRVRGAGLEHLKGLTNLTTLALDGTRVNNAGLEHLKGLTKLTALWLGGTQVSDAGLIQFKGMTDLRWLDLNCTGVSVAGLEHLKGLTKLTKLALDGTPVSSLGPVAAMTDLEELSLTGTPIADAALQALTSLPDLRKLDLNQTAVNGRGLVHLAKLPKLAELSLAGSKVSNLFAAEVGTLTKLERLSLSGCTFSDAGLKPLAGMSNLTHLDLTGTQVTADGVAALQKALPKCKIVSGPAGK
jgi:serine/threonine protein kinase/Leucine-rich repeat (LRR) protein